MSKNKKRNPPATRTNVSKGASITKGVSVSKAIAQSKGPNAQLTSTKLDIRQIIRQPLDLLKWRNATRVAESIMMPRRVLLYDMYSDVVLDAHVIAVIGKRLDAILTAKWQYVDAEDKPVDAVNQLLDSIGFADLLYEIGLSMFWGYSMVECNIYQDYDGRWQMTAEQYNRKHMRPETGMIAYDQNGDQGFSIREGRFAYTVLEAGKPRDLGLLISASMYAILKRNDISDWANFVEVFGQPILDAEWDGFDEDQRMKLLAAITAMGNSGKLVRPAGTKVTVLQDKGVQTGQLQDGFANFLNKEISKALLGSTETVESSDTSGYAQSEEHGQQDDKKSSKDLDFVRRTLISKFTKIMKAFGLPVDGGKFIIPDASTAIDPVDAFNMFVLMDSQIGMPVDHDFIYEFTGMPKPADYDAQMAAKKAATDLQTQQTAQTDNGKLANTPPASGAKNVESVDGKDINRAGLVPNKSAKLALKLLDFFGWPHQ